MTLDQRARAAAHDARRAVEDPSAGRATIGDRDRFHAYVVRKQRAQRLRAIAVAVVVAVVAAFLVNSAFRSTRRQPATPPRAEGRIVFKRSAPHHEAGRLFIVDPDGGNQFALPFNVTPECPRWFPDGSRILIQGSRFPGAPLRPATIRQDGTGLVLLDGVHDPNLNLGCGDISPDGTRLILEGFSVNDGDHSLSGAYTVRVSDGAGMFRVSDHGGGEPSYLPDGRVMFGAYGNRDPGKWNAGFIANADGTDLHRLTPWSSGGLGDGPGDASPDGRWIVRPLPDGTLGLIHPDGTGAHAIPIGLPHGSIATWPAFSPDGTKIVFQVASNGQWDLYTVSRDGSDLVRITDTPNLDESNPDWGPGG